MIRSFTTLRRSSLGSREHGVSSQCRYEHCVSPHRTLTSRLLPDASTPAEPKIRRVSPFTDNRQSRTELTHSRPQLHPLFHHNMNLLADYLQKSLPAGSPPFKLVSLVSPTVTSRAVYHRAKNSEPYKTLRTKFFFLLASHDVFIYAIELYVYVTYPACLDGSDGGNESKGSDGSNGSEAAAPAPAILKTVFVSKADTSGYLRPGPRPSFAAVTKTLLQTVLQIPASAFIPSETPLSFQILKSIPETAQIAMFTRPEGQYLFPNSKLNPAKHVLSGEELMQWWLKIVEPISQETFMADGRQLRLRIPGAELAVERKYLRGLSSEWQPGQTEPQLIKSNSLALYCVPMFPDDPKSRFIEHLVVEERSRKVSVAQFWEELAVRQEFRLGLTVSVIGALGTLRNGPEGQKEEINEESKEAESGGSAHNGGECKKEDNENEKATAETEKAETEGAEKMAARDAKMDKKNCGDDQQQKEVKSITSTTVNSSHRSPSLLDIRLSDKTYKTLTTCILEGDYVSLEGAEAAYRSFMKKNPPEMCIRTIEGRHEKPKDLSNENAGATKRTAEQPIVNDLSSMIRKRKKK